MVWPVAVTLATGLLVALALHGRRPEPGLVRFEYAGVMRLVPSERIAEVEIVVGWDRWRFTRTETGDWTGVDVGGAAPGDLRGRLERALHLLRASAPQRVMAREEVAGVPAAEFGLDRPRFTVSVRGPSIPPFVLHFGRLNPQGLAQYVRVDGRDDLVLLPRFVGEAWEQVIGVR